MEVFRQQSLDTPLGRETKLESLQDESTQIDRRPQAVTNPGAPEAFDAHDQPAAELLPLQIEISGASFGIGQARGGLQEHCGMTRLTALTRG